jgi:uncharacterized protein
VIKVVFDTNIIVSGLIANTGAPYETIELWRRDDVVLLISDAIIDEVADVLTRPFFRDQRHITKSDIDRIKYALKTDATIVFPNSRLKVVGNDPDDNRIIECALDGSADYIISGDHHLLELKQFAGIQIVTAKEFLTIFKTENR